MTKLDPVPGYVVKTLVVPDGTKAFINLCTDPHVPAPECLDPGQIAVQVSQGEDWNIPIVVGPTPRHDRDKAGSPCVVFDCVLNPNVLLLGTTEDSIKLLTIESCLEVIEDMSQLQLSRDYKIPRMKSKGQITAFEMPEISEKPSSSEPAISTIAQSNETKDIDIKKPKTVQITELSDNSSANSGYLHVYRGPYSGTGQRPSHVLELSGQLSISQSLNSQSDSQSGSQPEIKWADGNCQLPFNPSKIDAIYTRQDDMTYIFLYR